MYLENPITCCIFALILRSRAVAARWAHNPKVEGSSPSSRYKFIDSTIGCGNPNKLVDKEGIPSLKVSLFPL